MKCPYCEKEMERGYLKGDGRSKVRWHKEGERRTIADALGRVGEPEAIKYTFFDFKLFGEYCKSCKKLIIDTGITE
jgi:hypothetical protein